MQNIYIFWEHHVPNVNRFNFVSLTLWVCVCARLCECMFVCVYVCVHPCVCKMCNINY